MVVGDYVQRDDDSRITATGVVEEESGDLLDSFDAKFIQERRDISGGELRFLTVDRKRPAMWCMLRFGEVGWRRVRRA